MRLDDFNVSSIKTAIAIPRLDLACSSSLSRLKALHVNGLERKLMYGNLCANRAFAYANGVSTRVGSTLASSITLMRYFLSAI